MKTVTAITAVVAVLLTSGCVVRRPVHAAIVKMYCADKRADGSCATWATGVPMNRECVPSPAGVMGVCQ